MQTYQRQIIKNQYFATITRTSQQSLDKEINTICLPPWKEEIIIVNWNNRLEQMQLYWNKYGWQRNIIARSIMHVRVSWFIIISLWSNASLSLDSQCIPDLSYIVFRQYFLQAINAPIPLSPLSPTHEVEGSIPPVDKLSFLRCTNKDFAISSSVRTTHRLLKCCRGDH